MSPLGTGTRRLGKNKPIYEGFIESTPVCPHQSSIFLAPFRSTGDVFSS